MLFLLLTKLQSCVQSLIFLWLSITLGRSKSFLLVRIVRVSGCSNTAVENKPLNQEVIGSNLTQSCLFFISDLSNCSAVLTLTGPLKRCHSTDFYKNGYLTCASWREEDVQKWQTSVSVSLIRAR